MAKVEAKAILPQLLMPAAVAIMFCSATPKLKNLLGNSLANRLVRVDPDTGLPSRGGGAKQPILEAFIPGTEPGGEQTAQRRVLDGTESSEPQAAAPPLDPGGLY